MKHLFARRQDSRTTSGPRPSGRHRRRVRPCAEMLDSRLLMAAAGAAAADSTAADDLSRRVWKVVKPYITQDDFPGISVAVVTDGKVALTRGYGLSDVKTATHAEADTRFDIGSLTKTFTAIGVLMLYQESQGTSHPLDLNAPISDYLHNTKSFKLPSKWSHLTTMELLDMTTGITDEAINKPWQAQVAAGAKDPLLYTPGTKSSYSNTNYNLLGELIEQWTGESYATYIQDQILDPLGMSQTEVLGESATVSDQAAGYDAYRHAKWPKATLQDGKQMYAAAGMVSTAQDMATYMTALLDGDFLDPATYQLMWTSTPTPEYGSNPATDAIRGLGWDDAVDANGVPVEVDKSGSVPGFTSELILYPSTDSGVFVSFNANYDGGSDPSGAVALQVAQAIYQASQSGATSD